MFRLDKIVSALIPGSAPRSIINLPSRCNQKATVIRLTILLFTGTLQKLMPTPTPFASLWAGSRQLPIPPGRYKKCGWLISTFGFPHCNNKASYNKTDYYLLSIYTATRKYPAEYFCRRAYKKLALAPLLLIILRYLDKLFSL